MNNIELSTIYLPILDELYRQQAKTSVLEGDEVTTKKGLNGTIKIAKVSVDGLGDFKRNGGYSNGATTLDWETIKYDKERSQVISIDRLDDDESLKLSFATAARTLIRDKVIPETDAARIAKLVSTDGIHKTSETIADAESLIKALRRDTVYMDDKEVDTENRILFIRPELRQSIDDLDTIKSKAVLSRFSQIIEVPSTRMYSAVKLNDGTEAFGYTKADGAKDVNYLIVEKSAAVCALEQYVKYFTPDQDQNGDSHVFKYRNYNLYGYVYDNKKDGISASVAEA